MKSSIGRIEPKRAIPTDYSGITFRSRMEADTAFFLHAVGHAWDYEAHSFLLPSGDHFAPDFRVDALRLWVEPRGKSYPKGDRQIEGFASMVHEERGVGLQRPEALSDFLVIGPDSVTFNEAQDRGFAERSQALLGRCLECKSYFFLGISGDYTCRACGMGGGDYHLRDSRWPLGLSRGVILIDHAPMRDWIAIERQLVPLPNPGNTNVLTNIQGTHF